MQSGKEIVRYAEEQNKNRSRRATVARWLSAWMLCSFAAVTGSAYAQVVLPGAGLIDTVAGDGTNGYSGDGGSATNAELSAPDGVAVDTAGNIYIADTQNCRIRKVATSTGAISTVAGNGTCSYSGDGGPAASAELFEPSGVAVDSANNIYIADWDNSRIRKVTASTGVISTVAGNGTKGFAGDGKKATSAKLSSPFGVAIDSAANIYIADVGNYRIRKVTVSTGIISTVAGNGTQGYAGDGGAATSAELQGPTGVAVDSAGNIYIADSYGNRIRKVAASTGIISTVAGNGNIGHSGDGGPATSAQLYYPYGVAVDTAGNIYIADSDNYRIRKITASTGIISTMAGNGTCGYSGNGGVATSAEVCLGLGGLAVDGFGNVYIADQYNERTRAVGPVKVTPTITWATPVPISYGTALSAAQLNASTSVTGTFTYSPPSGTLLNAGSQTLSVTFTPTDLIDYSTATAIVTLTITPAMPTITWAAPAAITYGTALSAAQLDATANVPGTFVYSPAAGTVLAAGTQTLSVTFTPTNTNYAPTTGTLLLTVNPGTTTIGVSSSLNPSTYGASVTLAATLSPANAGLGEMVTFKDSGSPIGTGTISNRLATYSTFTLASGTHSITAVYGGDGNYSGSTSVALTQTVNKLNTSVALTSSGNPSANGSSVTFMATVTPTTATGTVTFADGSTTLGTSTISNGIASYSTSALAAGSHSITAFYGGDTNDNSSTSSVLTQTIQSGGNFVATSGQMQSSRYGQTATRSTTGQVLITGGISSSGVVSSADLYSLASQTFAPANAMNVARWLHTATLLNDGTVLVAGGSDLVNEETLDSAEIYNPATGTFTLLSNTLSTARVGHTATLLNNGQVLIVGGYDPETGLIADAELYDPPTQTFIDLGDTNAPRYEHTATMLQNGQVLIAGGETDPIPSAAFNTAEIFDLPSQTFTLVPVPMTAMREGHAAALLNSGQVLITGGDIPGTGSLNTAEIYDPPSNTFTAVASTMTVPRISHAMTALNGGKVLIAGGATDSGGSSAALNTAEVYDPTSQTFTVVSNMTSVREHQTASLLNDGTVLEAGGTDGTNIFNTSELYMPSQLSGLASIAVTPAASSIGAGAQQRFTAVGTFNDGSTQTLSSVLWSSSSATVAPISGDTTNSGVAATAAQGITTITASAVGVGGSTTLTITAPTLASITLSPQDAVIPLGATQQFTATVVYTDGSTQDLTSTVTWSSSATVVAVINSSGVAAGLFQGTATIQVNSGSLSASTTLSVGAPALVSIAVTPATATIALGSSQQYQAVGTYSDGSTQNVTTLLTWSSATPAVATVTNTGLATGLSQGTATLTGGFEAISASVTMTVAAPNLASITIVPNAASLSIGTTQQLSATGNYTDGSTQNLTTSTTWASSNSNVIGVSSNGLATAVATGNATITATSGSTSGTAALVVTGTTQANLNTSRYQHSATTLNNGQILVAGGVNCPASGSCTYLSSAELYNPATGAFAYTGGPMATARSAPAVQLNSGKVLVAGGFACDSSGNCSSLQSAEIYDPIAGTFSSAGTMTIARSGHTMTVLSNGTVLIAGGQNCTSAASCSALQNAEIYNPNAGTFVAGSNMSAARFGASAVLLNSGSVLIAGGFDGTNLPAEAEIYSPSNGGFTWEGPSLNVPRFDASATLLNNGQVLVAGGSTCNLPGCPTNAAEIYDPVANTFTLVPGGMNVPRFNHSATLTTNGQVVIAGGFSSCGSACTSEASTEFFDPVAGAFTSGQAVATALAGHTGTLVPNGDVLLTGGINAGVTLASDEWYQPTSLTPPGLVSITVAPASSFLMQGQPEQLVATGTFSDGTTQTLQSVIWSSSNPSVAAIGNSPGSAGIVNAQATGAATLTATVGAVSGSASLNVAGLVSLTIAPANPFIAVGSGQQLSATGTFVDGSQKNVTTLVTWSSSSPSSVLIGTASSGLPGYAMGAAVGTSTITATLGSISANTSVTVQATTAPNPPSITTVSPPVGAAGMQVTISGSGFGSAQGSGTVWLGTTYGTVVSWTNTQIVATVAAISQSGTAQVQQGGLSSNAVQFNVNTATISNVLPASGVPGTQVTITGSGFGAGPGQVWLGTANGVVQSWNDTQIIAVVATGSSSGNAQVLQNGVMSNAVPFAVNSLNIASVTPNSGGPGTSVTISGTGFGSSQGGGKVWLGSTDGQVMSWSNTQVVATVAASAVSGIAKIEQNGVWSNAVAFTVPTSSANALTIVPNVLNLVVGQTHTIQALNASNQPVTGLTWTSSNTNVVSLSTDDPPILTALAAGTATITAGSASADVTVSYATLAPGTVIWSNPGDGSGVWNIVPAVPSASGVADVFAFQADGTVQAIVSDGTTAWTSNLNGAAWWERAVVPDFQGGLVVANLNANPWLTSPSSIMKLDGITGQPHPAYTVAPAGNQSTILSMPIVHTDGTIFTINFTYPNYYNEGATNGTASVIGIDPTAGAQKFSVPLNQSTFSYNDTYPSGNCDSIGIGNPEPTITETGVSNSAPTVLGAPIIAGDGYFYIAYEYQSETSVSQGTVVCFTSGSRTSSSDTVAHLMLMRVGSDGSSTNIDVKDWQSSNMNEYATTTAYTNGHPYSYTLVSSSVTIGAIPTNTPWVQMITNADQGTVLSWEADTPAYCASGTYDFSVCNTQVPAASAFGLAATSGGSLTASATMSKRFVPVLQAQDGSFYGTDSNGNMIRFSQSGNTIWSVPNDYPQIATADGGVIGSSGITYDNQGRATGQIANMATQSWTGNAYQIDPGQAQQVNFAPTNMATTLWAQVGANPSGQSTAARSWYFKLVWQNDFTFTAAPNGVPLSPGLTVNITNYASAIKSAALDAFKQAYKGFPVKVSEGTADTGDNQAIVLNHQNLQKDPTCGVTPDVGGGHFSQVDYTNNMENAQDVLGVVITNAQTLAKALQNPGLIQAIGRAIGNTAAHETAHQFLLSCCNMDSNPNVPSQYNPDPNQADPGARGAYNAAGPPYCIGTSDPSFWLGYWPSPRINLHWESGTLQGLNSCLSAGWHYLGNFCSQGQ